MSSRRSLLILTLLLLTACQPRPSTPTTPPQALFTPTQSPTATPTPAPPRSLTVCLGYEPNTLYPYGNPNAAARSVLQAIYDGPIDVVDYEYRPVILQKLPSLADGDAVISEVTVSAGDEIVDADGNLVVLEAGVRVRPAGCRNEGCVFEYDGVSDVVLDQMAVTFTLLPDLTWSDGEPLTAQDSIYSFKLASSASTPTSKFLIDRTESYEAVDELSVQWWGKPGYLDPSYATNFWMPLPEHAWAEFSAADLLTADVSARRPLGWGPYLVEEWVPGDHIRLRRNELYFRWRENLPVFETLTFRFISDPEAAISALLAGKCDLLDSTVPLDSQIGLLLELASAGQAQAYFAPTMTMERLDFGIRPASYDDGYVDAPYADRADIFRDVRTRQAIAMCLDRQRVVDTVLFGLVDVPGTYLPPDHPLYNPDARTYPFDVTAATRLLDEIGWRDHDNDPSTPRQAIGVTGVPLGTPLQLTYITTGATQRRQVSEILQQSLAQCGIGVQVEYLPVETFYAAGPTGPLFGRRFDLAEFAMGTSGIEPPCAWYTEEEIPAEANHWVGTNVSGYSDPTFDRACREAGYFVPGEPEYVQKHREAQALFAENLPMVPLYPRLRVAAARPDLCNLSLDGTSASALWNIEALDYGPSCGE